MNLKHTTTILLTLATIAFVNACGSTPQTSANDQRYILTLKIAASDTQAALETKYHATALAFDAQAGFAMLSTTQKPATSDPMLEHVQADNILLSPEVSVTNDVVASNPMLQDTTSGIGGSASWSSGSTSWGSGWGAWSGGWGAWSGGDTKIAAPSQPVRNVSAWDQINLYESHRISRKFGAGIKVAVVDTGVDLNHPILSGRLAPSSEWKDFVDGDTTPQDVSGDVGFGHGTAVSGVILQIAPRATILPIRVLNNDGSGLTSNLVAGIAHAVKMGAQVINVSVGTVGWDQSLYDICVYANLKNVYITASAGNEAKGSITSPAQFSWHTNTYAKTIGIGSNKADGTRSFFSNYGPDVYGWAPGYQVWSAMPNSQVGMATGTSFSAPMFAGALALAQSETPNAADQIKVEPALRKGMDQVSEGLRLNLEGMIRALPGWVEPTSVWPGVYSLVSIANGKCVDVAGFGTTDGSNVQIWTCNSNNDNQRWKIEPVGSYFKLTAVHSGKVLEVKGASTADGANVDQWGWTSNATNQLWTLRSVSSGVYELVNQRSGKCLDVYQNLSADGTNIQQYTCKSSNNQRFKFQAWF